MFNCYKFYNQYVFVKINVTLNKTNRINSSSILKVYYEKGELLNTNRLNQFLSQ